VPLNESKARFDEALDVIFGAWKSDVFSHHGRFFNYDDVDMWPRPYQQPHPPLWIAGMTLPTIHRAARAGYNVATWPFVRAMAVVEDAARTNGQVATL